MTNAGTPTAPVPGRRPTFALLVVCGVLSASALAALAVGVSPPDIAPPVPIPVPGPVPVPVRPAPTAPIAVDPATFTVDAHGFATADARTGSGGPPVASGTTILIDYTAWQDGAGRVGTSFTRPAPNRVPITEETAGWVGALRGMRPGGVRQIRIPPQHKGGAEVLVEVAVYDVLVPPRPAVVAPEDRTRLASGIAFADVVVGEGIPAESRQRITFDYAVFTAEGTELDSSWRRAAPVRIRLGIDPLVFAPIMLGMTVGSVRQAWVPPEVAFPQGAPPDPVPPGQVLVLVVELRSVEQAPQ